MDLNQQQQPIQSNLINQQAQLPPQQQTISNMQMPTDLENQANSLSNDSQLQNSAKENSVQIPSQFATIGGFNNPQKVIIPTNVNQQQYRNVPRRNTVSAKASNSASILNELSNEMKDGNTNPKQNVVGAQLNIQQNVQNPPKVSPSSNNQKVGSPRVQFQQNPNSQIQFTVDDKMQHARPRRQSEMPMHNNTQQTPQQQKQRRVSEMQQNQQQMYPNQQMQQPSNQQSMQRQQPPQQQQYQNSGQVHPQQFQNNRFQQGQQQNPNQPYPQQNPQQINQNRAQQFQQNPQQINQNRPQYQQQNQQFQNPQQNMQNQFQYQQQMQQQNNQQRMPPNGQNPLSRPRRQTTKIYQQPYSYQRPPQGTNIQNNMPPQPKQTQDYSGVNHQVFSQDDAQLPKSSSAFFLRQANNAPNQNQCNPTQNGRPSSFQLNQSNQRIQFQQQQNWQQKQPQFPQQANRQPPFQQQPNRQYPNQQQNRQLPFQQQQSQQYPNRQQIRQPPIQQQLNQQTPIQQQQNQQPPIQQQNQQTPIQQPQSQQPPIQQQNQQTPIQQQNQQTPIQQQQNQQQQNQQPPIQQQQNQQLPFQQQQQQNQQLPFQQQQQQNQQLPFQQQQQQNQQLPFQQQQNQQLPFQQQQQNQQLPFQQQQQNQQLPFQQQQQNQSQTQKQGQNQNQLEQQNQLQEIVIPPLSLQQYNNESSSAASSPNTSPIKIIQSDILSDIEPTNQQFASSTPSVSPIKSPISDEFLSTKRVSFDKGVVCDNFVKTDEDNKINDSDSSDVPIESAKKEPNLNQEGQVELQKESISLDDVINECLFNCPLAHQIDDEACKVLDSSIEQFINTKVRPKNLKWFSCYIPSCSSQTNPYVDNLALEFSSKPEYKNNRTVKLFSTSIRHLKLNPIVEDLSSHTFTAPPSVMCMNDALLIKDRSKILPIVKKPINSASNFYVRKFKTDVTIFNVKDMTAMALPKRRYLNMSLMSFEFKSEKTAFEKVEPFFMCGYLINNGEMISEPWYFGPSDTKQFNPNIKLNQNGSFELPTIPLSEVYFVIVILRKLLPDNGAAINKYYKSPGSKTLSSAKEQAKYRTAYPAVFAPFAWTFLDVDSIVRNKSPSFVMPQPFLITGLIKPLYKSLKSVSGQVIPIDITFRVALQNDVIHPYELTFTNDCVLSLITYPPEFPRFAIYHSFYIRIISAALRTKKRNIYALLSLKKGETELPLIYYPYRIGRATKNFTKCWYHEKKPIFDDLYVCTIPNPIPPDFMIYIKFYNAALKNISGKGSAPIPENEEQSANSSDLREPNPLSSELIGIAKIPLTTEEGDFIPDGIKTYGVLHLEDNQTVPGCLTLETHLNSSFISSNRMLNHFYNKISAETMAQIDVVDAVINLFNLLDQLVVGINTEPEESVKSLVELSRKVAASKPAKAENKTDFIDFSMRYAISFSFISDQTISKDFHRNLLHNWALLLEADLNYRMALRAQSSDPNNNNVGTVSSSSNLLSMTNLSLSSGALPTSGNNSTSGQMSQSSSTSQISTSPRSSPTSPRSSQLSPRRTSNADNYQNESNQDNLALDQSQDAAASSNILSSDLISKMQSDCINFSNTDRSDFYLIDFFFLLIIKSLYLTNDQDFGVEFNEFTTSWSKSFNRYQIKSYSIFINLLFDIGHYTYATHAIGKQVLQIISTKQSAELLLPFLTQVLRPRLFYPSVLLIDDFVQLMQTIITYSKKHKIIFDGIFGILLRLFIYYSDQMKQEVTSRLINVYTVLCDYNELPIDSEDHSCIYFYIHLFQNTTFEAFQDWYSKQKSRTLTLFFNTVQWLINYVKNNDLKRILHFSILNILTHVMKLKNQVHILKTSLIVYNLFCCNLAMDFIPDLVTFFGNLIEQYYMWLVESSVPTIGKHIAKIFDLSCYCPNEADEFFQKLFDVDMANFNNHRRSMSICCHSLLFIKSINNVTIFEDKLLYPIVQFLKEYEILRKAKISEEKLAEIKLKRAMLLIHSPDATAQCIDNLISFHQENEYFQEELQTRIFKIALVFEYLGCTGLVDFSYLHVERPSLLFADECPIIKQYITCPSDGNFRIPSYCDSPPFSERSFICDMMFFITRTIDTKMYEFGFNMIDKFWPIMEHYNKYTLVSKSFKIFSRCYSESADIPSDVDRLFGRYFRVSFYGKCFENEDGNNYIYREKKLTHLFEISKRLTDFYSDLYQPTVVELIKEAGAVDVSTLDVENKGYIQVTFVEPSFKKKIDKDRITSYEKNHLLTNFFFDTPFTKEGKKAQSTIDQQWIRRTVLTVEHEMPSIIKRVKIIKETDREFPPIRVAYRQLRERITMFENAITQVDYRNIQQLLHGSLLVQVNEGPSRMAEMFLGDNCEKSKYTSKLEGAFKNFLEINEKALEMHGKWVTENPDFVPLQHELESGYASLVEKLSKWIS